MGEDTGFKESGRIKKKHRRKHYLIRILTVIGVIAVVIAFLLSPVFEIKKLEVEGNQYYTSKEVINMSGASTGSNLIFKTGRKEIVSRLMENPYFSKVKVKRKLPSTLVISVSEREQVACIKYGDAYIVTDVKGMVLRRATGDPKITLLQGLTLQKIRVGENVKAEEKETLETTLSMVSTMKKGDLYFKKIAMSEQGITAYIYDSLAVKGKPELVKKAIKSGNLQKVVNRLHKNKIKRGTITVGEKNYLSFSPVI